MRSGSVASFSRSVAGRSPIDPVLWRSSSTALCAQAKRAVAASARVRRVSTGLAQKRNVAELEAFLDLKRDHAASIAAISHVIGATEEQIDACEKEQAALEQQVREVARMEHL